MIITFGTMLFVVSALIAARIARQIRNARKTIRGIDAVVLPVSTDWQAENERYLMGEE